MKYVVASVGVYGFHTCFVELEERNLAKLVDALQLWLGEQVRSDVHGWFEMYKEFGLSSVALAIGNLCDGFCDLLLFKDMEKPLNAGCVFAARLSLL